jgi:hypothetical protein
MPVGKNQIEDFGGFNGTGNVGFGSLLYTAIPGEDSAADNAAWGFQT